MVGGPVNTTPFGEIAGLFLEQLHLPATQSVVVPPTGERTMTDAQDTLKNRLEHAQCLVDTFLTAEIHERIPQRLMDGLLFSLQELLE